MLLGIHLLTYSNHARYTFLYVYGGNFIRFIRQASEKNEDKIEYIIMREREKKNWNASVLIAPAI